MLTRTKNLDLPADLIHSAELRSAAREFFSAAGFDKIWAERLTLVADELFMNAVKYGCHADDSIKIELSESDGKARFAITDTGAAGVTPEALREKINWHGDNHTPHKTSGRGLAIITAKWTDDYAIERAPGGGLVISFIKSVETQPITVTNKNLRTKSAPLADTTTIELVGEIDGSVLTGKVAEAETFIANPANKNLILDLGAVAFINSLFIGKLAGWQGELAARGGGLALVNTPPNIREILDLVGLGKIIPLN